MLPATMPLMLLFSPLTLTITMPPDFRHAATHYAFRHFYAPRHDFRRRRRFFAIISPCRY